MNPDKIRNVLNILFMILALAAIITYFVAGKEDFTLSVMILFLPVLLIFIILCLSSLSFF